MRQSARNIYGKCAGSQLPVILPYNISGFYSVAAKLTLSNLGVSICLKTKKKKKKRKRWHSAIQILSSIYNQNKKKIVRYSRELTIGMNSIFMD